MSSQTAPPVHLFQPARSTVMGVPSPDLTAAWPFVRRGLVWIKKAQGPAAIWEPEHVWGALVTGQAELHLGGLEGAESCVDQLVGFVVTQPLVSPFVNLPLSLLIWMLYREPGQSHKNFGPALNTYLDALARERGYRYIEGITPFPEVNELGSRYGYHTSMYVLRKCLYPEGE